MKPGERKPISKLASEMVYQKYDGHCAYCGKEIKLSEMQVDHIIPIAHSIYGPCNEAEKVREMFADGSINGIENLMPSCRSCNYYKGMGNIEQFRERILLQLGHTCRSSFQTRLAMQYGMITYKPWDGKFYFETINEK